METAFADFPAVTAPSFPEDDLEFVFGNGRVRLTRAGCETGGAPVTIFRLEGFGDEHMAGGSTDRSMAPLGVGNIREVLELGFSFGSSGSLR